MSRLNYDRIRLTAVRLLDRAGKGVVLERPGAVSGPGWGPTLGTPTEYPLRAVDTAVQVRDAAGRLTGETTRVLYVQATGVVPAKGDRIQVEGEWHQISAVRPLTPGDVDLLYEVELVT